MFFPLVSLWYPSRCFLTLGTCSAHSTPPPAQGPRCVFVHPYWYLPCPFASTQGTCATTSTLTTNRVEQTVRQRLGGPKYSVLCVSLRGLSGLLQEGTPSQSTSLGKGRAKRGAQHKGETRYTRQALGGAWLSDVHRRFACCFIGACRCTAPQFHTDFQDTGPRRSASAQGRVGFTLHSPDALQASKQETERV